MSCVFQNLCGCVFYCFYSNIAIVAVPSVYWGYSNCTSGLCGWASFVVKVVWLLFLIVFLLLISTIYLKLYFSFPCNCRLCFLLGQLWFYSWFYSRIFFGFPMWNFACWLVLWVLVGNALPGGWVPHSVHKAFCPFRPSPIKKALLWRVYRHQ